MTTNTMQLQGGLRTGGVRSAATTGWLRALRRRHQRNRAVSELRRMSDWRLADLGIPRGQIPEVVDGLIARQGPGA